MDYNAVKKSGDNFKSLSEEELMETRGGRIIPTGVASAYIFWSSLIRDLLKKEDEK
jgi:hypothetical protein